MSATNRGSERQEDDFYATPFWCVDRLLEVHPMYDWLRCYDPCIGSGAIVKAVQRKFSYKHMSNWDGGDIHCRIPNDGKLVKNIYEGDFLQRDVNQLPQLVGFPQYDMIVMNPPFSLAEEFIKHSLRFAQNVFVLLRVNFLGSKSRRLWLLDERPDMYVLPDRPIFARSKKTGKLSSDATEYAWFHFGAETAGRWTILNETSKEDRDKAKQDIIDAERDARTAAIEAANGQLPF